MSMIDALKRSELFLGLDNKSLQKIVALPSCREDTWRDNETIFEEGDKSDYFYVLVDGRVNLLTTVPGSTSQQHEQVLVHTVTKGGVFGWSSVVPPAVRVFSAVSKGTCKVVAIRGDELLALCDADAGLGYEITCGLLRIIGGLVRDVKRRLVGRLSSK